MTKISPNKKVTVSRGRMRKEYRLDHKRSKPNRFAEMMSPGVVAVILEPDVAAVFKSSEAVNAILRSVIAAVPEPK
jgi:hypothetical protein